MIPHQCAQQIPASLENNWWLSCCLFSFQVIIWVAGWWVAWFFFPHHKDMCWEEQLKWWPRLDFTLGMAPSVCCLNLVNQRSNFPAREVGCCLFMSLATFSHTSAVLHPAGRVPNSYFLLKGDKGRYSLSCQGNSAGCAQCPTRKGLPKCSGILWW